MTTRNTSSMKEAIAIYQKLVTVLAKDGKYVKYTDTHSDATVATEMGASEKTVARIRKEHFGQVKRTRGPDKVKRFSRKQATLEARVAALEAQVAVLARASEATVAVLARASNSRTEVPVRTHSIPANGTASGIAAQ